MSARVVLSPAKINLFLGITGKRADGYHELVSVMCRVGLFDTVKLFFHQPSTTVRCGHPHVPEGSDNVAHKAAALFFEATSINEGVAVSIDKVIPVAAGLGGGSSNAASVLLALNDHYGLPLSREALMELGVKVGADVPFFMFEHSAVARGIGEKLEPLPGMPEMTVLLVCPGLRVSTAWVYQNLNLGLTSCEKKYKGSTFREYPLGIVDRLCNDLEQVTIKRFPEISAIKKALLDLGANGALMSGSGPSVFGLFQDPQEAAIAFREIKHRCLGETYLVKLLVP